MILHIATHDDWKNAEKEGKYMHSSLSKEGFIHCSTLKQTVQTANNFFRGQQDLILLAIDENALESKLKFEDPAGNGEHDPEKGLLFPHVYGPINLEAVVKVVPFPTDDKGEFELPQAIIGLNPGK